MFMIINRGYQKLSFITKGASVKKFCPLINFLENEMIYNDDLKFVIVNKQSRIQEYLTGYPILMAQGFVKDLLHEDDFFIKHNGQTLDEIATVNAILYKNNDFF